MKRRATILQTLRRNTAGVAALEFAIILPVMMLLAFGGYEGWRMVLAGQRIDNVAYSLSELSSRLLTGTTEGDVTNMLSGAMYIAKPFDMQAEGRVILSAIDASAGRQILWQRCIGDANLQSALGQQGSAANVAAIDRMPSATDSVIFVTEAKMHYTPPFVGLFSGPIVLSRVGVVPGRVTNPTSLDAGGPSSSC
jgi:TadE-like protein